MSEEQKLHDFFKDVHAVFKKHGMSLEGCGDCGSPWVVGTELPADNVHWEENSVQYKLGNRRGYMTQVFDE